MTGMKDLLRPDEHEVIGSWVVVKGVTSGDAQCDRIQPLVQHVLTFVADSPESGGWESVFLDPADGRYWERTYPQSEMHGGGPPALRHISTEDAKAKYRL
jgi:hypothetical protein